MAEKNYYRIMLGGKRRMAQECYKGEWLDGDWGFDIDLTEQFTDDWRQCKGNNK